MDDVGEEGGGREMVDDVEGRQDQRLDGMEMKNRRGRARRADI